ncbi:MAG: signal peptidase II, partial [Candidatus Dormibacteria bacterium]
SASLVAAVWAADQVTKAAVAAGIPGGHSVAVDRAGWLILGHAENCAGTGGLPRVPLILYAAAAAGIIRLRRRSATATALIAGGALGNLTSLLAGPHGVPRSLLAPPSGCVVDWIQVGAPLLGSRAGAGAPIFNLADLTIACGVLILADERFEDRAWAPVTVLGGVLLLVLVGAGLHLLRRGLGL